MRKLLFPIVLIIVFILLIIFVRSPGTKEPAKKNVKNNNSSTKAEEVFGVSSDKIYFQSITAVQGVPSKTATDDNFPGLSVFWLQAHVTNGQDTCTLYDNNTLQIYGSRYLGSTTIGDNQRGTTFYTNKSIKQADAVHMLDNLCFK